MATYTDYFSLTCPAGAENVSRTVINNNTRKIDLVMHQNRQMSANAYDSTQTYNEKDIVIYENVLYRCLEDGVTGNWNANKWVATTLADEVSQGGGGDSANQNIADEYDPTQTYAVGDYVIHDSLLYKCTTAVAVAEAWDSTKWTSCVVTDEMGSGGGGGSSTFAGLNDVDFTNLSDEDFAQYDSTAQKWKNVAISGVSVQPVIYSETEREIGVWADGKPLYQRTWTFSSAYTINANSWVTTSISNAGIEKCIECVGISPSGAAWEFLGATGDTGSYINILNPRQTAIEVKSLTLRYTKTADTPGSGTWTPQGVPTVKYSTSEHVVGTWIDGSTVYERVADIGSVVTISYTSWTLTSIDVSDVARLLEVKAFSEAGTGYYGDILAGISGNYLQCQTTRNNEAIYVRYIFLRYTKSS